MPLCGDDSAAGADIGVRLCKGGGRLLEPLAGEGRALDQTMLAVVFLLRFDLDGFGGGDERVSGAAPPFFVVDACGTEAQELLPVLLKFADGIILQSEIGSTHKNELALLISEIEPWREKLVGNIVVGRAA